MIAINYKLALLLQIYYKINETADKYLKPKEDKIVLECYGEQVVTELIGLSLDSRDMPILEYKDEFTEGSIGYDPIEILDIDGIQEVMRGFGIKVGVPIPVFFEQMNVELDVNID